MAIPLTHAELVTAVGAYINKRDLDGFIPGFIRGAETDLNTRLRDRRMIATRVATADCGAIQMPDGWLEVLRVKIVGAAQPLQFVTLDSAAGTACHGSPSYTLRGNVMDIAPEP